jgi:hypothetical protein
MRYLLLILITFTPLFVSAQDKTSGNIMLQLSKKGASVPVVLPIKKHRRIKVKTFNGEKTIFKKYVLLGDSAIASLADTVLLGEVKSIKASAQVTGPKNFLGTTLIVIGSAFTASGIYMGPFAYAFTGNPVFLLTWIPALGVVYLGTVIKGKRRFNTSKWELAIVPKPE